MPPEEISFQKDLDALKGLSDSQVQEIIRLLKKKRPLKSDIIKHAPASFLRLLLVYSKILETPDITDEAKEAIAPVRTWFDEKIPDIMKLLGIGVLLKQGKEAMEGATVNIPKDSDNSIKNISASMGIVTGFNKIPFLFGDDFKPGLRVFLMNREHVLLDSSGDWDDWLYVVKCLVVSVEEQAQDLAKTPIAWKSVPWRKVLKHFSEIKKALRSLDRRIEENAPPNMKATGRGKKK
jgi:hypothetical protein